MKRKMISLLLVLCMLVSLMPTFSITASAAEEPDYLTFTGTEEFTLFITESSRCVITGTWASDNTMNASWKSGTLEYSTDGENWTNVTAAPQETHTRYQNSKKTVTATGYVIPSGSQKVLYLRGTGIQTVISSDYEFYYNQDRYNLNWELTPATETGTVAASGNIMTLLDYNDPDNAVMDEYCFYSLFRGFTALTAAPELPATELSKGCYRNMFDGCTSLTAAPELSSTELAVGCYSSMFEESGLTTAPELPAKIMQEDCYFGMFEGCSYLKEAPELPATQLADSCYANMFVDCYSLQKAPDLPAIEIPYDAYDCMFCYCIALQEPPEIAAEKVASLEDGGCEMLKYGIRESIPTGWAM